MIAASAAASISTAPRSTCTRYLAEFDFRYSNRIAVGVDDTARAALALQGVVGKRLTYRRPDLGAEASA